MPASLNLRSSTAAAAALIVAGWGVLALPAAADPGNGNGNGNANGASQAAQNPNTTKDPKGPKDPKDPKGNNGNHGQGNNGNHNGQGNDGKGPKDDNGNHGQGNNVNHNGQGNSGGPKGNGHGGGNGDPAGNNGTVKITPHLEDDGIPQNTPHVTCVFDIEWYGFDEGADIISTVEFAMQAPTSDVGLSGTDPSTVFVGGDPASGAGTDTGFDGEATYHLVFDGEPHPQQGYHVKLTVHTPGSQGADTKHKVFWVEPCEELPAASEAAAPAEDTGVMGAEATNEDAGAASGSEDGREETGEDIGEAGTEGGAAGADAGEAGADVPNQVDAGGAGSRVTDMVTSPIALLVVALGLALAGAAFVARRSTS
jgi:hypothetical protein